MSVVKRGKGWQAAVMHQGKRLRRQFRSEAEAHAWVRESEARITLGFDPAGTGSGQGHTLQEAFDACVADVWRHRKAADILIASGRDVGEILGWDRPLDTIDKAACRAIIQALSDKGLSNGTINRKLAGLSKMLRHAVEIGLMSQAPRVGKLPERQGRIRWLTVEEEDEVAAQLRHHGRPRMADLVHFLADTGMRVGEALRLTWEDITESDGMTIATVWESKSGQSRSVPLTKRVQKLLAAMDRERSRGGPFKRVNQDQFNREWQLVRQRLGKDGDKQFVPHALRHTCASRLVQRGVEILVVKEVLGHKTLAMTLRYSHLAPKTLKSAINVLDRLHSGETQ